MARCLASVVAWLVAGVAGDRAEAAEQILTRRHCVTVWTTDDGLPDNTVGTVARTADGYLWIGTSDRGVARFNGIEFRRISAADSGGVSPARVYRLIRGPSGAFWVSFVSGDIGTVQGDAVVVDRSGDDDLEPLFWWLHEALGEHAGNLWFSTNLGDIARRSATGNAARWTRIATPSPDVIRAWKSIVMAADHTILGTDGAGGVWRLEGDECRSLPADALAESGTVMCLTRDRDGRIWAGTEHGLAAWDGAAFVTVPDDLGNQEQALAVMPVADGGLWVLFHNGLRKYRDDRWEAPAGPWSDRLRAAVSSQRRNFQADDGAGGLWMSTDGEGLWHVSATGQLVEVTAEPGFPGWQINCMEVDAEGSLWLGFEQRGLARVRPRLFTEPDVGATKEGAALARSSHSMCVDRAGTIWLAERGGGVWRTVGDVVEQVAEPVAPDLYTSLIAPANGGGIWLAPQFAPVFRQDQDQRREVFHTNECRSVVRSMFEDQEGRLWLGNEYGLWRWQDGAVTAVTAAEGFEPFPVGPDQEPRVPGIDAVADDGAGGIWIGLGNCELRYRDPRGKFSSYRPPWWDFGIRFWSLLPDGAGGVWIGTLGSGLVHFRDGVFRRVTVADGLADDAVGQVLDDGSGFLWLGTFSGVVRVSRAEIEDFFQGRLPRVSCRRFGRAAGLPVAQCAAGMQPCCLNAPDGRLWFSTNGGVVVVDPAAVRDDAIPPPIVVEEARVKGRNVLAGHPPAVRLPPRDRTVQFAFAGLSLAAPELTRYRWRMVGIDRGWINGGLERTATYNQLPPGSYAFEVNASDGDGRWSGHVASVPVVVEPFVWETAWFRGLSAACAALATAGIAVAVIRWRTARRTEALERQNAIEQERARIARDLHDDLGASLTEIDLLGALAERGAAAPPDVADRLGALRGKAREAVMSLDEIVWAVNPGNDSLGAVADYVGSFAQQFFHATGTRCRLDIDPEPRDLPISSEVRHALFLSFKEAINNVVRHGRAAECRIRLAAGHGELALDVVDDGCGFDASAPGFVPGDGLRNIRERLAAVGGRQRVDSAPGRGTTVAMAVPVAAPR